MPTPEIIKANAPTSPGARFALIGSGCTAFRTLIKDVASGALTGSTAIRAQDIALDGTDGFTDVLANQNVNILDTGGLSFLDFLLWWRASAAGDPTVALKFRTFGFVPFHQGVDPASPSSYNEFTTIESFNHSTMGGGVWIPLFNKDGEHEITLGTVAEVAKLRTNNSGGIHYGISSNQYVYCGGCQRVMALHSQDFDADNLDSAALLGRFVS